MKYEDIMKVLLENKNIFSVENLKEIRSFATSGIKELNEGGVSVEKLQSLDFGTNFSYTYKGSIKTGKIAGVINKGPKKVFYLSFHNGKEMIDIPVSRLRDFKVEKW